jgi:hypothetical protein
LTEFGGTEPLDPGAFVVTGQAATLRKLRRRVLIF